MSALVDKVYTLGNLMSFDENGLNIASFVDIKKTLIDRMRQLYGIDIDVSDASVDGQWITEIALLINNTFQAFNNLYANLNPAVAQGKALDLLASFSNIIRRPAQASICEVQLQASYDSSVGDPAFKLYTYDEFIDKNGLIWIIDQNRPEYLPLPNANNEYCFTKAEMSAGITVPLICKQTGAIAISANTIEGFVNITSENSIVNVSQSTAGIRGSIEESDVHLRARRNQSTANEAITVVEGMQGALMTNTNVLDAYIINHIIDAATSTGIKAHSAEVIVRTKFPVRNANDEDNQLYQFIADTIYARLTPGIPTVCDATTTSASVDTVTSGKNTMREKVNQIDDTSFVKVARWAEAMPIAPVISVTLSKLANCDETTVAENAIKAIANYANNLGLLIDLDASTLLQEILFSDPKYQGRSTFYCTPADIELNGAAFTFKPFVGDTTASAQARKTFYQYDDTMVAGTTHNQDSTIIIAFQ